MTEEPIMPALQGETDHALALAAEWAIRRKPGMADKPTVRTELWTELPEVDLRNAAKRPNPLFNGAYGRLVDALHDEGFRAVGAPKAHRSFLRPGQPMDDKALLHEPIHERLNTSLFNHDDAGDQQLMRAAKAVVLLSHYLEKGYPGANAKIECEHALSQYAAEVASAFPHVVARREPQPFAGVDALCTKLADEVGGLCASIDGISTPWRELPRYRLQPGRSGAPDKGMFLSDAFSAVKEQGYHFDEPTLTLQVRRHLSEMDEGQRSMFRRITQDLAVIHRYMKDSDHVSTLHEQQLPMVSRIRATQFAEMLGITHDAPNQAEELRRTAEQGLAEAFPHVTENKR